MSLLQDVLRTQTLDSLDKALAASPVDVDSDDELINVVCPMFHLKAVRESHHAYVVLRSHYQGLRHSLVRPRGLHRGLHRDRHPQPEQDRGGLCED